MLQTRLAPALESQLGREQAGFRKRYSTIDHLHTLVQIQEKTLEWQIPLWTCFIDFEKAFDSIEHDAIWNALSRQGVSDGYVELLQRLYADQLSRVSVDAMLSRSFCVQRGVKQGDPLSTLLFNAVLEDILRELRPRWELKRYGLEMSLGVQQYLTCLCFADDVLLIATSSSQLREMIGDLAAVAQARGLKVHSGKTKVLTNAGGLRFRSLPEHIEVSAEKYEVLSYESSTKYLGRKVCYKDAGDKEFDNRIAAAWGAFSKHKQQLTNRQHRLKDRLRLFDAVITSSLLYGCETWSLRVDQERRLKVSQRKMLRMVLNAKRRPAAADTGDDNGPDDESDYSEDVDTLEPWPDFLRRVAQWTEQQLANAGLSQWTVQWRRRKWRFASKLLDESHQKWSRDATLWQPFIHSSCPRGRRQARPRKRWEQDFLDYIAQQQPQETRHWHQLARDSAWWLANEERFAAQ